MSPFGLRRFPV